MILRNIFSPEHEQFRDSVRRFVDEEIVPHHERWEEAGVVDRELWTKAGAAGLLCPSLPEAYGGFGADFLFNVVIIEELARAGATGARILRAFGHGGDLHFHVRHRTAEASLAP